jgi:hypothetical protein
LTWPQCIGFIDAVVACLCPQVRNVPAMHLVERNVTVRDTLARTVEVAAHGQCGDRPRVGWAAVGPAQRLVVCAARSGRSGSALLGGRLVVNRADGAVR